MRFVLCILFLASVSQIRAQFCEKGYRITPQNYLLKYRPIHRDIKRVIRHENLDVLEVLARQNLNSEPSELCSHNQFLFTDFILYFDLEKRYAKYSEIDGEAFEFQLLTLRDSLYLAWLSEIKYGVASGYHEWETYDVKGSTINEFQDLGSEKFSIMERVIHRISIKPSSRNKARLLVDQYLDARTPFSSIMTTTCFDLIRQEAGREAIDNLFESLSKNNSQNNLWELARSSANGDSVLALQLLSTVAAQRMYLIRDYKVWMEQNMDSVLYEQNMSSLMTASAIYFKIETVAKKRGIGWNYPTGVLGVSPKSYHFYTAALLAYQLSKEGFDRNTCIQEATRPGKKYKRAIQIPGLAHNIWLGSRLTASTVGDYKQVLREQELGAIWGCNLALKAN